jgi:cytochrome c oxidase subunit IV
MAVEHHAEHPPAAHGGHEHHITPPSVYLITFVALIVLMAATVAVSFLDLGPLNNFVAMAIAVTKAVLVVLFFMQVKYGTRLTWLWAALGFIWFLLLFGILSDYVSRGWVRVEGWENLDQKYDRR